MTLTTATINQPAIRKSNMTTLVRQNREKTVLSVKGEKIALVDAKEIGAIPRDDVDDCTFVYVYRRISDMSTDDLTAAIAKYHPGAEIRFIIIRRNYGFNDFVFSVMYETKETERTPSLYWDKAISTIGDIKRDYDVRIARNQQEYLSSAFTFRAK